MHDLYITESYRPGAIFAADRMDLSSFTSTQRAQETAIYGKVVRYGRSRSSKLVTIDRKPIYDFLLVLFCNYMPIF